MRAGAGHGLRWSHGEAVVLAEADMLATCRFVLDDGWFEPFATAPWTDAAPDPALPGHLRHLGAEFVGLPFGCGGPVEAIDPAWQGLAGQAAQEPNHGPAANATWTVVEADRAAVTLRLELPEPCPIRMLERRIAGSPGEPALDLSLLIEARRGCAVPLGLHPILRLPGRPGALRLEAGFAFGLTYPGRLHPGRMASTPGRRFTRLDRVPAPGGTVDLGHLPLARAAEDVVQLCDVRGPVRALFLDEVAALTIDWERDALPSLLIWLSDRALTEPPWLGRYRGLGLEPIAAAFDLAPAASTTSNPIDRAGVATALPLAAGEVRTIRYRLAAERLAVSAPSASPASTRFPAGGPAGPRGSRRRSRGAP